MGRKHTFMDEEFGRPYYDPDDQGSFERGIVFVAMPFHGDEMREVYSAQILASLGLQIRSKR